MAEGGEAAQTVENKAGASTITQSQVTTDSQVLNFECAHLLGLTEEQMTMLGPDALAVLTAEVDAAIKLAQERASSGLLNGSDDDNGDEDDEPDVLDASDDEKAKKDGNASPEEDAMELWKKMQEEMWYEKTKGDLRKETEAKLKAVRKMIDAMNDDL